MSICIVNSKLLKKGRISVNFNAYQIDLKLDRLLHLKPYPNRKHCSVILNTSLFANQWAAILARGGAEVTPRAPRIDKALWQLCFSNQRFVCYRHCCGPGTFQLTVFVTAINKIRIYLQQYL